MDFGPILTTPIIPWLVVVVGVILREAVTQRGAGGRLCLPVGGHRALTPGPGSFGCNGLEELSQVGYITTVSGAAGYSKVQNIVKLYLYYFVTTRDGMETKTIPPHELLFCPCSVQLLEECSSVETRFCDTVSDPQQRLCFTAP